MHAQYSAAAAALLAILSATHAHGAAAEPQAATEGVFAVPFNTAEAILDPFWDEFLSGFPEWQVEPNEAAGLQIKQNWAAVDYEWVRRPAEGPALRMNRTFNSDVSRYDTLIVRLVAPKDAVVRLFAETDAGAREKAFPPAEGREREFPLPLDGASRLDRLTIEVTPGSEGSGAGWLRWVGLQHSGRLEDYLARWDYAGMTWDAYITSDDDGITFTPRYGIFLSEQELAALREAETAAKAAGEKSPLAALAEEARTMQFEAGIHEFASTGGDDNGMGRERDMDQARLPGSTRLALAGLVLRDADALRAAVRHALSIAMSEHWTYGFMEVFPGSSWESRVFRQSYRCSDIAFIMDLAGEVITEPGRLYLLRRLSEAGVAQINYVAWRYDYIFACNQLGFFNTGRMDAYAVMEREWPRVRPYTDLAFNDTVMSLELTIPPDGGGMEGPTYFGATINRNLEVLKTYSRARGLNLPEIVPDVVRKTGNYAALIASTTDDDVIPICDSGRRLSLGFLEVMNDLVPNSYWTTLLNHKRVREGKEPLAGAPELPAFVAMPDTGPLASLRMLDGRPVKILVMGHNAKADHTHEDKGSFVLEFGGEAFAADFGIVDYDDPIHHVYKQCQRHNMLVPAGLSERAHPLRPIPYDVKPSGEGDATRFHARIDATPGWAGYYKRWVRTWDSPAPDTLVIRDEYALEQGDGVEFYWQTQLPVEIDGRHAIVRGAHGAATITAPEGATLRVERLPLKDGEQNRIAIHRAGAEGELEVRVKLSTGS